MYKKTILLKIFLIICCNNLQYKNNINNLNKSIYFDSSNNYNLYNNKINIFKNKINLFQDSSYFKINIFDNIYDIYKGIYNGLSNMNIMNLNTQNNLFNIYNLINLFLITSTKAAGPFFHKNYSSPSDFGLSISLIEDNFGNLYSCGLGSLSDSNTFGPSIKKFNSVGNFTSSKVYNSTIKDSNTNVCSKLLYTDDNKIVLVGGFGSIEGFGGEDILISMIDPITLDPEWNLIYGNNEPEVATGIIEVADGFVVCAKYNIDGQRGKILIIKIDKEGNEIWKYSYHITGNEFPRNLAKDNQDNIYLTGYSYFPAKPIFKSLLLVIDTNGQVLVNNGLQYFSGDIFDQARQIEINSNIEASIVGVTSIFNPLGEMLVLKLDQNRNLTFGVSISKEGFLSGALSLIEKNNQIIFTGTFQNFDTNEVLYPIISISSQNGSFINATDIGIDSSTGLKIIETKDNAIGLLGYSTTSISLFLSKISDDLTISNCFSYIFPNVTNITELINITRPSFNQTIPLGIQRKFINITTVPLSLDQTDLCFATDNPTISPTNYPTMDPTSNPSNDPTSDPSNDPTKDPTTNPTYFPTKNPTISHAPTTDPTNDPTINPTLDPTNNPTTKDPTNNPTFIPTIGSTIDINDPTSAPTINNQNNLSSSSQDGDDSVAYILPIVLVYVAAFLLLLFIIYKIRKSYSKKQYLNIGDTEFIINLEGTDDTNL
ncbi:MAG: hypothetical protein GY830_06495 [Bacteroidetes bacterium]|nr:hypothetical protein [Bacteroidota bacterium]